MNSVYVPFVLFVAIPSYFRVSFCTLQLVSSPT